MKNKILILGGLLLFLVGCTKNNFDSEHLGEGKPSISNASVVASANFGDSIRFSAKVGDESIPLSTLKAQLYFSDVMVSETVIRTKEYGEYNGKIFVPMIAKTPEGTATLKLVAQNIGQVITEQKFDLALSYADYPYLTLITESGKEYKMSKVKKHEYVATDNFPKSLNAIIRADKVTENGSTIYFGWDSEIVIGSKNWIPFTNMKEGNYEVSFNIETLEAAPFIKMLFDGKELHYVSEGVFEIDAEVTKNQIIEIKGIPDFEKMKLAEERISRAGDNSIKFLAPDGKYRFTFDFNNNTLGVYFIKMMFAGKALTELSDGLFEVEFNAIQNQVIEVKDIPTFKDMILDVDYMEKTKENNVKFLPMEGTYKATFNFKDNYVSIVRFVNEKPATLSEDGHGAIYILGTGMGKPSLKNEPGWNPGQGYAVAEIASKVYQVTLVAGKSIKSDSFGFKFFHQDGWAGGEFSKGTYTYTEVYSITNTDGGDLTLQTDKLLEEGATYVFTMDINKGNDKGVLTIVKK